MDNSRRAYRKKRRMIRRLQRLIPAAVAVVLIAIIVVAGIKTGLFESFFYSYDKADLYRYFGAIADDSAVVIRDGEITDEQIKVIDGYLYMDLAEIKTRYTQRFYYDIHDAALLYTTANEVIKAPVGGKSYTTASQTVDTPYTICAENGKSLWVALDYVEQYVSFYYQLAGGGREPYRAMLFSEGGSVQRAEVTQEQAVRKETEKKSDILKELKEGDAVTVLEEGKDWTKVMTDDLIIGFYETRYLDNFHTEQLPSPDPVTEPEFQYNLREDHVALVWDMVTSQAANNLFQERTAGMRGINTISPTWFYLTDSEGNMECIASHQYVENAHNKGLQVWGLVENITYNSNVNLYELLSYSTKREFLVNQLISYAKEYDLHGINMDIETLSSEAGDSYTQFIRELFIACRRNDLVLSLDVYVPSASSAMYNREQLGLFVDYMIIMGYDEHYSGSAESGSVASLNFVVDGINNTLKSVPSKRVINAVPFYTRMWVEIPKSEAEIAKEADPEHYIPYKLQSETLSIPEAKQRIAEKGAEKVWLDDCGQYYAEWEKGDRKYKIWLEDQESLLAKIQAMKSLNLGGIAAWQLGYATDEAWEALSQY